MTFHFAGQWPNWATLVRTVMLPFEQEESLQPYHPEYARICPIWSEQEEKLTLIRDWGTKWMERERWKTFILLVYFMSFFIFEMYYLLKNFLKYLMMWKNQNTKLHTQYDPHFIFKKDLGALAGVAQWTECQPVNQRVTSSIPVRAQAWVAGQVSYWGCVRGNQTMFLSLSFSLLSPSL